jgi:hypothetical protein
MNEIGQQLVIHNHQSYGMRHNESANDCSLLIINYGIYIACNISAVAKSSQNSSYRRHIN